MPIPSRVRRTQLAVAFGLMFVGGWMAYGTWRRGVLSVLVMGLVISLLLLARRGPRGSSRRTS